MNHIYIMQKRMDDIEEKLKHLEKENKETYLSNSQLMTDLMKSKERE
jgi:hypothetical protein